VFLIYIAGSTLEFPINLPESLVKKIEEVISNGNHGYPSIPDFMKTAVRRYLRERGYLV